MLRALGIPSVLGCEGLTEAARRDDLCVLDGGAGTVVVRPNEKSLALGREALAGYARERTRLNKLRRLPSVTTDGEEVDLQANMEIPAELPWVLQVDGHTDRLRINTPRFPSNWELSTARAIAVARYLVEQGIAPDRVAARGFAEFQPLDPGAGGEALRRNRRIEIKLTTR